LSVILGGSYWLARSLQQLDDSQSPVSKPHSFFGMPIGERTIVVWHAMYHSAQHATTINAFGFADYTTNADYDLIGRFFGWALIPCGVQR
jgi:hypothetical protein